MKKALRLTVLSFLVYGLVAAVAFAERSGPPVSFTADFTTIDEYGEILESGKFYGSPEGIRIEGSGGGEPFMLIVNFPRQAIWSVMVEEKVYMEWVAQDVDEFISDYAAAGPCADFEGEGALLGRETLQGRQVEKWRCEDCDGAAAMVWFDTKLHLPIRVEEDGEVYEMKNIKKERIAGSLFLPPSGYEKRDVSHMMPGH